MEIEKQIFDVFYERKKNEKKEVDKYNDLCKKRLVTLLKKKLQTVLIGGIDEIEKTFGHLWGIGKQREVLNDNEKKWLCVWNDMRERLLTKGNNQIRGMESELERHTVIWNRYNNVFKSKKGLNDETV